MLLSLTRTPTALRSCDAVECLSCGAQRVRVEGDACGRCGYVGWAPTADLTEQDRRTLREVALESRAPRRQLFAA